AHVAVDLEVRVHEGADPVHLFVGEVADAGVDVETQLLADLLGRGAPDAEDVGQRDLQPLLAGDVDACDACHVVRFPALSLISPGAACAGGWCKGPGRARGGGSPCTSHTSS